MDLFEKCRNYTLANEYRSKGIYPYFHALESRQDTEVIMEGKRRIMLGSNNYLGLTTCPEVIEAGIHALEQYGTGCSGSRFLNGTLEMHLELERELGDFLHRDGIVTFSTGFQSNLGIISALVGRTDYIVCDRENHASIYDGCRLSYGKMLRYRHADMEDLEAKLASVPEGHGILIVTDGVFSMAGDIAKLPDICRLAKKYGARVMVDDAHGLGVIGEGGRGTANYYGHENEVDVIMGTFSKSLASLGGFMAASAEVADYVRHNSRYRRRGFIAEAKIVNTDGTVETIKTDLFYGDKALLSAYLCDCNQKFFGRDIPNSSDVAKLFGGNFIGQWVKGTQDLKTGVYTLEDAGYASYFEEFKNGSAFVARGGNLGDDATIFLVQTGKEEFTVYTGINAVPTMKAPVVDIALFVDESPDVDLVYIPKAYTGTTESFFVLDNTPVEKTSINGVTVFGVKVWNEANGEFLVFMDGDVYDALMDSDFEMPYGDFVQNATFNEDGYMAYEGAYKFDIDKDYLVWGWAKVNGKGVNTITDELGHVANIANTKIFVYNELENSITAGSVADLEIGDWFCADTQFDAAAGTWTPGVIFVYTDGIIDIPR